MLALLQSGWRLVMLTQQAFPQRIALILPGFLLIRELSRTISCNGWESASQPSLRGYQAKSEVPWQRCRAASSPLRSTLTGHA